MKRLVIVADNSLIVEAMRVGLQRSGEFKLLGYANGHKTSARTIAGVQADVILLDEMDRSHHVIPLIREIKAEHDRIDVIVLTAQMDHEWIRDLFDAGATAVISKASHPVVVATLVRETLNGHIVHCYSAPSTDNGRQIRTAPLEDVPLTARELEILQLVAAGSTNGEVARKLWITEQTVKFHLRNIYRKLAVANRTEASHLAHINGLLDAADPQPALSAVS